MIRRWVVLARRDVPSARSYPVSLHWFRWKAQRALRRRVAGENLRRNHALDCGLAYHGISYWIAPATPADRLPRVEL